MSASYILNKIAPHVKDTVSGSKICCPYCGTGSVDFIEETADDLTYFFSKFKCLNCGKGFGITFYPATVDIELEGEYISSFNVQSGSF